jgi:uroporphyrinogen decarboxylase
MSEYEGLKGARQPDWRGLVDNILRKGTPRRVFHMELFHDGEIRDAIAERFDLMKGVRNGDPNYDRKKMIAVNRFCGWDYVVAGVQGMGLSFHRMEVEDTAGLKREGGRHFQDEHSGPIMNWEQFEKYPWPDPKKAVTEDLEWYEKNLPEDMCVVGGLTGHFAEEVTWLMGYETLCYALYDQRDLVRAISEKLVGFYQELLKRMLAFDRVKMIWASDDMGYKTGLMISAKDTREFILPGHRVLAAMTHEAGRAYLLHACGKLTDIIGDLADDVKIDAKHSFEDTIEDVRQVKGTYGRRMALIGGIDVDFLCRQSEQAIRRRVRETLDACLSGGGYCLGTGNSVANYIPLDHYLAMVDEGMLYSPGL